MKNRVSRLAKTLLKKAYNNEKVLSYVIKGSSLLSNMSESAIDPDTWEPLNYTDVHKWAAHPSKFSKALFQLDTNDLAAAHGREVDVFFIHPTTYLASGSWNSSLTDEAPKSFIDELIMPAQVSVFNQSCNIYAPYYRQANIRSFLAYKNDSKSALSNAYQDVKSAFLTYLEDYNDGKPYIIAAHSQGSMHGLRLLSDVIESNADAYKGFISAYLIGYQIPAALIDSNFTKITESKSPTDTKTIIAYDTFGVQGGPIPGDERIHYYEDQQQILKRGNNPVISVNPLSFSNNPEQVDKSKHLGGTYMRFSKDQPIDFSGLYKGKSIPMKMSGIEKTKPENVSTHIDEMGFLKADIVDAKKFKIGALPNHNYHVSDYSLFYCNLQQNIDERIKAFLNAGV